jgi:hypothetical protein
MSDEGLLGGPPGPRLAAGAICAATDHPAGLAENPRLAAAGVSFSFYDCRLRLVDHTSRRFCIAAGGGGGQAVTEYTVVARGSCHRPIFA